MQFILQQLWYIKLVQRLVLGSCGNNLLLAELQLVATNFNVGRSDFVIMPERHHHTTDHINGIRKKIEELKCLAHNTQPEVTILETKLTHLQHHHTHIKGTQTGRGAH